MTVAAMKKRESAAKTSKENLLVSYRTVCDGKLHTISIHRNGQLVFHNHSSEEIKRELGFAKIGGDCCRCAQVAKMYITNRLDGSVPDYFVRECPPRGDINALMAWRIWRRKALKRGPAKDLFYADGGRCSITGPDKHEKVDRLIHYVRLLLSVRGYITDSQIKRTIRMTHHLNEEETEKTNETDQYVNTISAAMHNNGYIVINAGYHRRFSVTSKEHSHPPIRFLADLCERRYFEAQLDSARNRNRQATIDYVLGLEKTIIEKVGGFAAVYVNEPQNSLFKISFNLDKLTVQAASQIVDELNKIRDKIARIAAASRKRIKSAHRFPPVPNDGLGRPYVAKPRGNDDEW